MDKHEKVLLKVNNLEIGYSKSNILAHNLNFSIESGQVWSIVGPNGSGKTTLIKTILGLIKQRQGTINKLEGLRIGYVPQRSQVDLVFPVSCLDIILMGSVAVNGPFHRIKKDDREKALDLLERVGLKTFEKKLFRTLSGGQKQRVLIARALAVKPDLVILDEPTDGMDLPGEADLFHLLETLRQEIGITVMVVTHALHLAAEHTEYLMLFQSETDNVEIGATKDLLTPEKLTQIYKRPVEVKIIDNNTIVYIPLRKN